MKNLGCLVCIIIGIVIVMLMLGIAYFDPQNRYIVIDKKIEKTMWGTEYHVVVKNRATDEIMVKTTNTTEYEKYEVGNDYYFAR